MDFIVTSVGKESSNLVKVPMEVWQDHISCRLWMGLCSGETTTVIETRKNGFYAGMKSERPIHVATGSSHYRALTKSFLVFAQLAFTGVKD